MSLSQGSSMKNTSGILNSRKCLRIVLAAAVLCTSSTVFWIYGASLQSVQLTIVNNSAKDIRYLYLSPAENDNWGPDQLNNSGIGAGARRTVQFTWEPATIKLVAEDQDGCFLTKTVTVSSSIEWMITSDTPRNCG
jgi:hypothetical protein